MHNEEQNLNENNHQPAQLPPMIPPMPEIFSQQVQQLNLNQDYQHESNSLALNYNDSQFNKANGSSIRNNESNSNNQITEHNQSNRKLLKCNSSSSNYAFKSYYRSQSPNFIKNESSTSRNVDNNENISKKITDDFNWQSKLNSVKERNSVLFNNDYMSDLTLLVGNCDNFKDKNSKNAIKIPVHKHCLAAGSPVFYAMLYGDLAEKKPIINLPDDDPQGIMNLLR